MIILYLGNVGSGKTACAVRDMMLNPNPKMKYYTNIVPKLPKQTPRIVPIDASMIIKKELERTIKKRSGDLQQVYKYSLNIDFWKKVKKPISVVIDEAHSIINARRPGSKVNVIVTDFIALLRRVLGEGDYIEGDLVLISQLDRRIDIIAREMAHQIRYHICHYQVNCACGVAWTENSDMPEKVKACPGCGSWRLAKSNFKIEVKHFKDISSYDAWKSWGMKSWHRHYIVDDIEDYFQFYDTLQWDNLFADYY